MSVAESPTSGMGGLYLFQTCGDNIFLSNSADTGEMLYYVIVTVAFHLGPHCLPKDPFRGFQYAKSSYSDR